MEESSTATQQAGLRNAEGYSCKEEEARWRSLPKTAEELQMLLQSEADKRVTQALKTAHGKWQQELVHKLEEEKKEAERLIRLASEQREREALESYRRELEEKERDLRKKDLELKAISLLVESRLPVEFKEFVLAEDEETTLGRIEKLRRLWGTKLEEAVSKALAGIVNVGAGSGSLKPMEG